MIEQDENMDPIKAYFDTIFNDFFNVVYQQIYSETHSIPEYRYFFSFLFPLYIEKALKAENEATR